MHVPHLGDLLTSHGTECCMRLAQLIVHGHAVLNTAGDWFNALDWTCQSHRLGVGLPVRTKNGPAWFYKAPLLARPDIRPRQEHMQWCHKAFCQLLRIRWGKHSSRPPEARAEAR